MNGYDFLEKVNYIIRHDRARSARKMQLKTEKKLK